ncbi:MAG: hypothetical protein KGJ07_05305 [Patescibacteria group bacterium]|nr:hypothetical protein [Patescibacteria group bacterium]
MGAKTADKRFSKLLGLLVLVLGVAATAALTITGIRLFGHAAPTENPENIRITNVTDLSFTVTYETQASVIGSISYGKDQLLGQVALDDRDQPSGIPTQHTLHSITVRSLQPQTTYYFSILSGKTTYLNNGIQFTSTTGTQITTPPTNEEPLSGILNMPDGSKPSEALLYVTTDGGQTLSTLVKPTGLYVIPLNTIRTANASAPIPFTQNTKLQVLAIGADGSQSKVILLAGQRNPVPSITLSNNYDFTLNSTPLASTSALPIGFPQFALDNTVSATPEINTPKDNETFTDNQPLLKGQALPDATVDITIHSDVITTQVTADKFGNWSYRPTSPLAPGQHTITITTKDKFGSLQTITKAFTIFWSGTQVAEAATPSATPTFAPTSIPTTKPTPTPTISITISPTPTPTIPPFVITPTKATGKTIPSTGNESGVAAALIGLVTMSAGVILFLVTYSSL